MSTIDPDALKVLTRLNEFHYTAYLVGGGVRDLLLGRRPKDFDIGTSAHPYQIKKLFRNCWIIGRRFRLAHVKFGDKAIEVATFRQHIPIGDADSAADAATEGELPDVADVETNRDLLIHRDNTFGTPEEDAFRRDFTINALFYDIADHSIIDYVGGLRDIDARVIRSIGDPNARFQEDPVRMLRAVVLAARLDFALDPPVVEAIVAHRHRLALAAPARLIEEYYKVLRSGYAEKTFLALAEHRLLEPITPELQEHANDEGFLDALDALDSYRQRFDAAPPTLSNPVLLGTMVVPLGLMPSRERPTADASADDDGEHDDDLPAVAAPAGRRRRRREDRRSRSSGSACCRSHAATPTGCDSFWPCSAACRTWRPRRGPNARCCTAAPSRTPSPGSRCTAARPRSWNTGAASSRPARSHRTAHLVLTARRAMMMGCTAAGAAAAGGAAAVDGASARPQPSLKTRSDQGRGSGTRGRPEPELPNPGPRSLVNTKPAQPSERLYRLFLWQAHRSDGYRSMGEP